MWNCKDKHTQRSERTFVTEAIAVTNVQKSHFYLVGLISTCDLVILDMLIYP